MTGQQACLLRTLSNVMQNAVLQLVSSLKAVKGPAGAADEHSASLLEF